MRIRIKNDLNIKAQAEDLGISIWRTPSFLFILLGFVTALAMTVIYSITKFYDDQRIVIIAESIAVVVIFSIGRSIIAEFEQIAMLNKAKNEFISIASHQLRTPLSSIRWQIELLFKKFGKELTDAQKESIEGVDRLSLRMIRLVNDLLNVTRIDQKRLFFKYELVNLNEIIKDTVEDVLPLAKAKNIEVFFKEDQSMPQIMADKERIRLVIDNLVSNAVKYTLAKGRIEIIIRRQANSLIFSVTDNGVGIPADQQKHVFEKFYRSDNVLKYQTEGTGLGLYIVKSIIEQLRGRVWFISEENKGTTFNFSIRINK